VNNTLIQIPTGNCVVCGVAINADNFHERAPCILAGPEGTVFFCSEHVDPAKVSPTSPAYKAAVEKVALAQIAQMQSQ
jgi:hypothetical protein